MLEFITWAFIAGALIVVGFGTLLYIASRPVDCPHKRIPYDDVF